MKTLADRIVERRTELGLTQADIAKVCGVSVPAVAQWESGATKNLKNGHLFELADFLNVHPRWLATGEGPKEAAPGRTAYRNALARRDAAKGDQEEKRAWERVAAGFAKTATVLLFLIPPLLPSKVEAAFNITTKYTLYFLSLLSILRCSMVTKVTA